MLSNIAYNIYIKKILEPIILLSDYTFNNLSKAFLLINPHILFFLNQIILFIFLF